MKKKSLAKLKKFVNNVDVEKVLDNTLNKVTKSIENVASNDIIDTRRKKEEDIEKIKNYKVNNNYEDIMEFFIKVKKSIKDKNIDIDKYNMWFLKIDEVYEMAMETITDEKSLNKITDKYKELKRERKLKRFVWLVILIVYIVLGFGIYFGLKGQFQIGLGIGILISTIITFLYFNIDFTNIKESIKHFKFEETTENVFCIFIGFISILLIVLGGMSYFTQKSQENEAYNRYHDESAQKYKVSIEVDFENNLIFSKYDVTLKIYDKEEYFKHGEDKTIDIELPKGVHKLEFSGNDITEIVKLEIDGDTKVKYKIKCHSGSIEVTQVSKKNNEEINNE